MRRALILVATLSSLVALSGSPAAAQTGGVVDRAVDGLRSDPVYVDPAAEKAGSVDAGRLRRRVSSSPSPMFIAVLPPAAAEEAGGDAGQVATELGRGLRRNGTYAAMAGDRFSAASSTLGEGRAAAIAVAARAAHPPDDIEAVLVDFVDRVAAASGSPAAGSGGGGGSGESQPFGDGSGESEGGGANIGLILLLLLAAGGGGLFLWNRKRRKDQAARDAEEAEDRNLLEAELSVLADDVMSLEPQVALHPEAADDYQAATSRFQVAQAALASADDPIDLVRVRRVVDESRYAMSRARAIVQGREPPPPPPDLVRPGRHGEPAVDVNDGGRLGYVGYDGPFYGGGGWFGGGGGLFTGLFLGQMLGGWGGGWGGGSETNIYNEGDGGDGGDGGGGGGDFGGGDFGGGDFGGGDFGGGDFGGGDF